MKQKIILLYAGAYRIVDERTGRITEGITCNYYFNVNLDIVDNANGTIGTRPAKGSLPIELMPKIVKAPALYDATFEMTIGSDGKPVLKICDLDYLSPVVMQLIDEKAPEKPDSTRKAG